MRLHSLPYSPLVVGLPGAATQRSSIPFNRPHMVGTELRYVQEAHANLHLAGDGQFTALCSRWLEQRLGVHRALLTQSCTAALEMAALLAGIGPGDEIIMPSFTFVSTANAFVLQGGVPVFVDIRPDTLNIDETRIADAITPRTKAIVVVHYAGVACEMNTIMAIAKEHDLLVIEDAAHGILSTYRNRPLGSIGQLGALSFHETKNITCGEGGALLINDPGFVERAQIIREKGTNRTHFLEGRVDKYTWVDVGSSYLPSDLTAAFLWGQMEAADRINDERLAIWNTYHCAFAGLERAGKLRRPIVPNDCMANAHMYYVLLPPQLARGAFLKELAARGIGAVSHYVPLHDSPAGKRFSRQVGELPHTAMAGACLVRLPLWLGLQSRQDEVVQAVCDLLA